MITAADTSRVDSKQTMYTITIMYTTCSVRRDAFSKSRMGSLIACTMRCGRLWNGNRSWNPGLRQAASYLSRACRMAFS
eukprot:1574545-Pyramimonas_sp.AAC.1